jgi:S1-C subfamily serine protease
MVQQELGLGLSSSGIIVVDAGPVAPRIGLRGGDVILEINGSPLDKAQDFDDLLRRDTRRGQILVDRGGDAVMLRFRL